MIKLKRKFVNLVNSNMNICQNYIYCATQTPFYKADAFKNYPSLKTLVCQIDCIRNCHANRDTFFKQVVRSRSLATALVDNSSDKIKPYLKLMRLHQPTGMSVKLMCLI